MDIAYLMADAGGVIVATILIGGIIALFGYLFLSDDSQQEPNEFIPFHSEDEPLKYYDDGSATDDDDTDWMIEDLRKKGKEEGISDEAIEKQLKKDFPEHYKPPKD